MIKAIGFILFFWAFGAGAVDLSEVERELQGEGVIGWIHGAAAERSQYVFTVRNPQDFFDYAHLSLVAATPAVEAQLAGLKRHDQVQVQGRFLKNPSPQKHIEVSHIQLVKPYASILPAYPYQAQIPADLMAQNQAHFLVHAISGGGHILVVEYKDVVLPVYVSDPTLAQKIIDPPPQGLGLFRNDVVKLSYRLQRKPDQPTHLRLLAQGPIEVVEAVQAKHGQKAVVEGALVRFPQSPEIRFEVFAVEENLPAGLRRQYTLVNFDSPAEFARLRTKLESAWNQHPGLWKNGRNKQISQVLRVRATGVFNVVDPNQANVQILINSADDVEIVAPSS